jgi:hypothetical protein
MRIRSDHLDVLNSPVNIYLQRGGNMWVRTLPLTKPHAAPMNHDFKRFRDKNA